MKIDQAANERGIDLDPVLGVGEQIDEIRR